MTATPDDPDVELYWNFKTGVTYYGTPETMNRYACTILAVPDSKYENRPYGPIVGDVLYDEATSTPYEWNGVTWKKQDSP